MPEVILSDYFYGDESEGFIYFKIPRLLITDHKFKHVSTDAKLLYGMLLDRMGLSAKNDWYDDSGRVYIYYTVDEICEDMCCGRDKAMKLLAELDRGKGIGLIERIKQGQGRPTKLYVKRFTIRTAPPKPAPHNFLPNSDVDFSDVQRSEKSTSRSRKSRRSEVEKTDPNHRELSADQKRNLMQFVSHTVSELKMLPWPKQFRKILPYYLIKYIVLVVEEGQLDLLIAGDVGVAQKGASP